MPTLPDFWFQSLFFWILVVPIHIVVLGVAVWAHGIFAGVTITLTLLLSVLLGVFAVEYFLAWLYGPGPLIDASYKGRAVRQMAPWMLGITLGCFPLGAWFSYVNYKTEKRSARLEEEHERSIAKLWSSIERTLSKPDRNP